MSSPKRERRRQNVHANNPDARRVCRDFMNKKCTRDNCRFIHDTKLCFKFWKNGSCKYGVNCRKKHEFSIPPQEQMPFIQGVHPERQANFVHNRHDHQNSNRQTNSDNNNHRQPYRERRGDDMTNKFVDMRIVVEQNKDKFSQNSVSTKDVVLVPNVFSNFEKGALAKKLLDEINAASIPKDQLFKLWHSDCHYIADDKLNWKEQIPTFNMIINRMQNFFNVRVEATRLNYFKGGEQFKHWHHDRASFHKKTAEKQNFTICLNLGATRTIGFRKEGTRTILTTNVDDGQIYCFSKQVNIDWEHAVLKQQSDNHDERLSIVIWGWIDNMNEL